MSPPDRHVTLTLKGAIEPTQLEPGAHHRFVATRPRVWRPEHSPFPADRGSALLVPAPWTDDVHPISVMLAAINAAQAVDDPLVFVAGCVEPDEDQALGRARADTMAALVQGDAEQWVELATQHGSIADIKAYLQYLNVMHGWACAIEHIDRTTGADTKAAVDAFQREYNHTFERSIEVDGICGKQTLGAVYEVLRDEWDKWLDKHGLEQSSVDAMDIRFESAADAEPTAQATIERPPSSGVELLVVPRSAFDGDESVARIYESQVARVETYEVPLEPWAWARGPYTIVTDLLPSEPIAREVYTLESSDGEYRQQLALPDDATDTGVLELCFVALPCDKHYRLAVAVHEGGTFELFRDVPYNQLHRLATTGLPEEHP